MDLLNEIYIEVKENNKAQAKAEVRLCHIEQHLKTLNGSVAKHAGRLGIIESTMKYNKGIIFGISIIISAFWAVVSLIA